MKRWIFRIVAGLTLAGLILAANHWLNADQPAPPEVWQSMATGQLEILRPDGEVDQLTVRIAQTPTQRAQGMQFLPAAVIREHPIWFVFETPQVQSWHMRNVQLALDILYVDANGLIIGREMMEPQGSGYGIGQPIAAALELAAGQAEQYGLRAGVRLQLQE